MKLERTVGHVLNLLAVLVVLPVTARSQGTITANPLAVDMLGRQLWRMEGRATGDFQYGGGIGGGIDINGDGYGDFFVYFGASLSWRLFYGGTKPDTLPEWVFQSAEPSIYNASPFPRHPVIGDFYGDGRKVVGLGMERYGQNGARYYQLRFFGVDSGRLVDTGFATTWDMSCTIDAYGLNVDDRVGDELVRVAACEGVEVWFYRGGIDFAPDHGPAAVVRDTEELNVGGYCYVGLGDIDGDGRVDMVTAGQYRDGGKLKFYWGSEESPWSWTVPDRVIVLDAAYPSLFGNVFPAMMDLDGDGIEDLVFQGGDVYRSGRRKTIEERRERSYRLEDADAVIADESAGRPVPGGYLNDSARKYEMVLMTGGNSGYWYSGGANGVDGAYEAYFHDGWSDETVFSYVGGLGDVGDIDGDGWSDYGTGNAGYIYKAGVAVIFRGGPVDLPQIRGHPRRDVYSRRR